MIDEYTKFEKNGLTAEVNWNDAVKPCKKIRITVGGQSAIIEASDFAGMILVFGTADQGSMVTEVKREKMEAVTRLLHVKLKKDMKKDEYINFPFTYFVPSDIVKKVDDGGSSGDDTLDKHIRERKNPDNVKVGEGSYPQKFASM